MRLRTPALVTALALLAAAPATAQSPDFRWSGTLSAGKTLEIRGVTGDISAEPASGNTIEVTAVKREHRRGSVDDVEIKVVEGSDGVTICAVYPTPRRAREENHCGSGRDYQMNTNDNDVEVAFTVKVPRGVRFEAGTVNGSIRANGLASDASLNTVNGGIDVTTSGVVEAATVNGRIQARLGRADWSGALEFSTVNGSITVTAPASLSTDVEASTVNGSVDSDFPITVQGRMQRRQLRGTIGSGGRSLELTTVNGGIELRREG